MKGSARTTVEKLMMEYFEAYNGGDYEKVASIYYAEDAVLEFPADRIVGRKNILEYLVGVNSGGTKEILRPTNILIDGDNVAVQINSEFKFSEDAPDFFLRPAKKGDSFLAKIGVFYKIRDDKIVHITIYEFRSTT